MTYRKFYRSFRPNIKSRLNATTLILTGQSDSGLALVTLGTGLWRVLWADVEQDFRVEQDFSPALHGKASASAAEDHARCPGKISVLCLSAEIVHP